MSPFAITIKSVRARTVFDQQVIDRCGCRQPMHFMIFGNVACNFTRNRTVVPFDYDDFFFLKMKINSIIIIIII